MLGLLLCELLCGRLPETREPARATGVSMSQLQSGSTDGDDEVRASARGTTVARLRRKLRGDLETIVGKALEKESERRYASAAALSEDISRYLTSQPILARPPS